LRTYLELSEIQLLADQAGNLRDRLLVHILFHLGCRVSEALNLIVDDIDFDGHVIRIQHLKTRIKLACSSCGGMLSRSHSFCPKCGGKISETVANELQRHRQRIIPVDVETLNLFREYIKRSGPVVKDGKSLIFGINRHRAWQITRECADKAGLPNLINPETGKIHHVSPHRLRDAFAINAVKHDDSGDGLRLLQEYLGHASFNTTAKYRKISGEEQREWYNKLRAERK
jgi:integrase/recombinase XerD